MRGFHRRLRRLGRDPAGRRFQNLHSTPDETRGQGAWRRITKLLLGLLLIPVGLFMLAVPGPGLLVVVLGLGIIASGFRPVARILDRAEVRARDGMKDLSRRWLRASLVRKLSVLALFAVVLGALGWGLLSVLA